jgi:hypothetical protein
MTTNTEHKLFIIKVKITDIDSDTIEYNYDSIFANDAEQALYIWNEEMLLVDTERLDVTAVEVFSTESVIVIEEDEVDE